jgi:hypothetical protein
MDVIPAFEEELGEIRSILARNTGDKGASGR